MNQPDEIHIILRDRKLWNRALAEIHKIENSQTIYEMILRPFERLRTLAQNARYWATLTELLRQMHQTIHAVANETGYSALEVKRLIAADMPQPEYIAILFCSKAEPAHEVLKQICDVPTSTRLGTKKFMLFEERMIETLSEIAGIVNAFARRAA